MFQNISFFWFFLNYLEMQKSLLAHRLFKNKWFTRFDSQAVVCQPQLYEQKRNQI